MELTAQEDQCLSLEAADRLRNCLPQDWHRTIAQTLAKPVLPAVHISSCTLVQASCSELQTVYFRCCCPARNSYYKWCQCRAVPFPFNSQFIECCSPFPTAQKRYPFLFKRNGMKWKRHCFYASYYTLSGDPIVASYFFFSDRENMTHWIQETYIRIDMT